MKICMAMAMDRNRLIGDAGGMPWHLPDELRYFRQITMGKPLLMGRKTYESIAKPLPGRTNIVLTKQADWQADGVIVAHDLQQGLSFAKQHLDESAEVMVIGGAGLCEQAMPQTEKLYLTVIDHEFEGDVWFNSYKASDWREVSAREVETSDDRPYSYTSFILERKAPGQD